MNQSGSNVDDFSKDDDERSKRGVIPVYNSKQGLKQQSNDPKFKVKSLNMAQHHDFIRRIIKNNETENIRKLTHQEAAPIKESGLRNIITLINQVQNVIDKNTNVEPNAVQQNQQKSKSGRKFKRLDHDVETAVATIKVSDVKLDTECVANTNKTENCQTTNFNDTAKISLMNKERANEIERFFKSPKKINEIETSSNQLDNKPVETNNTEDKPTPIPKSKHTIKINTPIQSMNDNHEVKIYPMPRYLKTTDEQKHHVRVKSGNSDKSDHHKVFREKRPLVRTIQSLKDPTRVYKAVSFVENKKKHVTPLKIKIPHEVDATTLKNIATFTDDVEKARTKLETWRATRQRFTLAQKRKEKKTPVQDSSLEDENPQTEVAKWKPCDDYSKPCYEAWVDTKLTAVSQHDPAQKARVLETYKRTLERIESCDLIYQNYTNEKYTGKIKIRTRGSEVK